MLQRRQNLGEVRERPYLNQAQHGKFALILMSPSLGFFWRARVELKASGVCVLGHIRKKASVPSDISSSKACKAA